MTTTTTDSRNSFPSPTADQLRMIKVSALNMARKILREEKAHLVEGMRLGYLADSALDGLTFDVESGTLTILGFAGGRSDEVLIRHDDGEENGYLHDLSVRVTFNDRPWIPTSYAVSDDCYFSKTAGKCYRRGRAA